MIPCTPDFATVPSVLSAWHRCRQLASPVGQPNATAEGLYTNDYSLGAHARWLADTVLDGRMVPAKIIDHHTHVPLFASMMTLLEEFAFREELLHSNSVTGGLAKRFGRLTCIESKSLRRCPSCVAEDRKLFGCAHWRLFHQWPVARHCVVHGDALETCCGACRTPFVRAKDAYLADDPCRRCGGTAGATSAHSSRPMPDGYWSLLNEMYRLLRLEPCTSGEWRYMLPALPENHVERFPEDTRSTENAQQIFECLLTTPTAEDALVRVMCNASPSAMVGSGQPPSP